MYSRDRDFETSYKIANQIIIPVLKQWDETLVQRILDIGCGVGGYALALAEAGAICTAVDLDAKAVEYARKKAEGRVEFIAEDMFAVKFEQKFDLIFCHDVIEHVDPAQLLALIVDLLRPGGKAFVTFPPFRGPNGGHQIGPGYKNFALWWIPYIHLWPRQLIQPFMSDYFRGYFDELSRISLSQFRKTCQQTGLYIQNERLYLIRPEFQIMLGIPPLRLPWNIDCFVTGAHFLISR